MAHRTFRAAEMRRERMPLVPGDFVVTHGTTLVDRLIQLFTASRWNHAALITAPDGTLIEAATTGVRKSSIDIYPPDGIYVVRLDMAEEDREQACAYAEYVHGKHARYGIATIATILLKIATGSRLVVKLDGTLICSELVARALGQGGVLWDKDPALITPADLYNAFVTGKRPLLVRTG